MWWYGVYVWCVRLMGEIDVLLISICQKDDTDVKVIYTIFSPLKSSKIFKSTIKLNAPTRDATLHFVGHSSSSSGIQTATRCGQRASHLRTPLSPPADPMVTYVDIMSTLG